ncbi:MAG: hypothetical protein AAF311_00095 [Pseudomonadota bacterium]
MRAAKEQLERRRLARLVDALPVFSGFASPDGHLMQARPQTSESFLWSLPEFAYAHDSVTQVVDMCEKASKGERVQVERPYLKETVGQSALYGRGLLTLSPILDDKGHVEELAVTLLDCDEAGLTPHDAFAKSRLSEANARIESMLSLAQTVVEVSHPLIGTAEGRDRLSDRLDALAAVIETVSEPDLADMPIEALIETALEGMDSGRRTHRLQLMMGGGAVPITYVPLVMLLLSELVTNACLHGAWRDDSGDRQGTVAVQSEVLDSVSGRVLRLHWIEDGGPPVSAVLGRGFGFTLGERLFPQITGGTARLLNSEDGISWTFELPIPDTDDFDFDGIDA